MDSNQRTELAMLIVSLTSTVCVLFLTMLGAGSVISGWRKLVIRVWDARGFTTVAPAGTSTGKEEADIHNSGELELAQTLVAKSEHSNASM